MTEAARCPGPRLELPRRLARSLRQARRALRVLVRELDCQVEPNGRVRLMFALPPGSYATVVLGELFTLDRLR